MSIETKLVDVENGKQTTVVMLKIKNQEYDEHQGKLAFQAMTFPRFFCA